MAANSVQLGAVLEQLRAAGIEERDLQTSGLSLNPNWQQPQGEVTPRIVGYLSRVAGFSPAVVVQISPPG
jgi:uncharacterized protein YggE